MPLTSFQPRPATLPRTSFHDLHQRFPQDLFEKAETIYALSLEGYSEAILKEALFKQVITFFSDLPASGPDPQGTAGQ